jgi:predicted nucleotidyltransferase
MKSSKPSDLIVAMGFPTDRAEIIHAYVGGSALHGVKLEGSDDTDIYGIYIEKPWLALGIDRMDHFVASTSPQTRRNAPGDVDVMCYSLRKWATLAAKGNPTILHSLFTPARRGEREWSVILRHRGAFLARTHANRYIGYAEAQLKRMQGLKGSGKHGQRPEIIGKFRYDTKAAMHTLRILFEGIELMEQSWVTLPRPENERKLLLEIRRGQWSEDRVIRHATRLLRTLQESSETSDLPESVDRASVSKLLSRVYVQKWSTLR